MNSRLTIVSHSEAETDQLGSTLASVLTGGLSIALNGQLGSGKTRLVRSICAGLGIDTQQVNSPTFVILQLYVDGRIPVAHFDTYRLGDTDEFLAIGADEYLDSDEWLCLIEWAERVAETLPADRLTITIEQTGETVRAFELQASGPRSAEVLRRLKMADLRQVPPAAG
jgi:tRNA threonylcarbamoyladenosine biosynthesis protein TsaE